MPSCACPDHACTPSPFQTERYLTAGGHELCAACYVAGHDAPIEWTRTYGTWLADMAIRQLRRERAAR